MAALEAGTAAARFGTELGHQIFVYNEMNTKQVLYSLRRSLRNNRALKQLQFVGKKSVPAALRKDLWQPLCVLSFSNQLQGLSAYRMLREFKHLHEVAYPKEDVRDAKGRPLSKPEKIKALQNQKANSIADMAHVLKMQKRPPTEEELRKARLNVLGEGARRPKAAPAGKFTPGHKETAEALEFRGSLKDVSIWWADPLDAEFAESWPEEVLHGPLAVNRYTAVWPPPEEILLGKGAVEKQT